MLYFIMPEDSIFQFAKSLDKRLRAIERRLSADFDFKPGKELEKEEIEERLRDLEQQIQELQKRIYTVEGIVTQKFEKQRFGFLKKRRNE
jgi:hypothetical protein